MQQGQPTTSLDATVSRSNLILALWSAAWAEFITDCFVVTGMPDETQALPVQSPSSQELRSNGDR